MSHTSPHLLKGKSVRELEKIFSELGEPAYRAKQAFRRINKQMARSLREFTEFPLALRNKLEELEAFPEMRVVDSTLSRDGTEKLVLEAGQGRDGKPILIETVWLLSGKRRTVCVSTQAGCSLNCAFCATGTLPFRGNLEVWQIVEQVYTAARHRGEMPTNIVYMGMGEPMYNYENVIRASHILHHPEGLNLSARHITISTAGVIPGIERMIQDQEPFNLAISLNHTEAKERLAIMDVEKKFPLDKLLSAAKKFSKATRRAVTFEYVMIPDVNMGIQNARRLIKIARSMKSKVNLIPLNTSLQNFRIPTEEEVVDFQDELQKANLYVFNRGSAGKDINGACGMLALAGSKTKGK